MDLYRWFLLQVLRLVIRPPLGLVLAGPELVHVPLIQFRSELGLQVVDYEQ